MLHGTKVHVLDAAAANLLLVTARDDAGLGVYGVDAGGAGVHVEPAVTVDGTRKEATVRLEGARGWRLGDRKLVEQAKADDLFKGAVATALAWR